jgi:hypothetical protein
MAALKPGRAAVDFRRFRRIGLCFFRFARFRLRQGALSA